MTKGIEDPKTYYYRRVFVDALRALEAVRSLPDVDASSIAVQGISQGGGITLAAAGLANDVVAVMPDVPFLCHFRRAADICDEPRIPKSSDTSRSIAVWATARSPRSATSTV